MLYVAFMNKIPEYISYSGMTTFNDCGEKYRLTRVEKVDEGNAYFFAGGTSVHSACDSVDYALLGMTE